MFDILNKKELESLRSEVQALREEKAALRIRLEKQELREKKALAAKQGADVALKECRQTVERLEEKAAVHMAEKRVESLSFRGSPLLDASHTRDLLFRIRSLRAPDRELFSATLVPGRRLGSLALPEKIQRKTGLIRLADSLDSPTGIAIFYDITAPGGTALIAAPPFGIRASQSSYAENFQTDGFEKALEAPGTVAILVAHAGESFIGLATGDGLIESALIRSEVKEKHSKGGWSQRRFERLREEDIRRHAEKAEEAFNEMTNGDLRPALVVAGGDETLAEMILSECDLPVLTRQLSVKPDKRNAEAVWREIWSTRWYILPDHNL